MRARRPAQTEERRPAVETRHTRVSQTFARDISFRNIQVNGAKQAASIEGLPEVTIEKLQFENITINAATGFQARLVHDIDLEDVTVNMAEGPEFQWNDS
jgi:hypothetical protein